MVMENKLNIRDFIFIGIFGAIALLIFFYFSSCLGLNMFVFFV